MTADRSSFVLIAAVLSLAPGVACGRGSAPAVDGPDRLVATLTDRAADPHLRAAAGAALIEGSASARLSEAMTRLDVHEREAIIPVMVPLVAQLLGAAEPTRAGEAREALHALRVDLPGARAHIDEVLLPALERDLRAGRALAARQRVKDLLLGMGPVVVPRMLALLADPAVAFATPVEVVRKLGDRAARGQGGAALVRHAQDARPISAALYSAIAILGGDEAVRFLCAEVESASPAEATLAAAAMIKLQRAPSILPFARRVAADSTASPAVREHLRAVLASLGNQEEELKSSAGSPGGPF